MSECWLMKILIAGENASARKGGEAITSAQIRDLDAGRAAMMLTLVTHARNKRLKS